MKKEKLLDLIIYITIFAILCTYFGNSNIHIYKIILYEYFIVFLTVLVIIKIIKNGIIKTRLLKHFYWYLFFVLYGFLSLIWTIDNYYSFLVLRQLLGCLLFIFDLSIVIESKESLIKLLKLFIISLMYAIVMLFIFERNMDYYGISIGFNRNLLAISYAFGISFIILLVQKKYINKLYLFIIPLFLFIIFLTGSRKGVLLPIALIAGFLFANMGLNFKKITRNIFLIIIVISVLFFIINSNDSLSTRMNDLLQSFKGENVLDGSINERKYYKEIAKNIFSNNKLFGIGINGFAGYMNYINYRHIAYSHTNWWELLCTLGIIGFIMYYVEYLIIIIKSFKNINANNIETYFPLITIIVLFVFEYGFVSYMELIIQLVLFALFCLIEFKNEKYIAK